MNDRNANLEDASIPIPLQEYLFDLQGYLILNKALTVGRTPATFKSVGHRRRVGANSAVRQSETKCGAAWDSALLQDPPTRPRARSRARDEESSQRIKERQRIVQSHAIWTATLLIKYLPVVDGRYRLVEVQVMALSDCCTTLACINSRVLGLRENPRNSTILLSGGNSS